MNHNSEMKNTTNLHNTTCGETNISATSEALKIVDENLNLNKKKLDKVFSTVAVRPVLIISMVGDIRTGQLFLLGLLLRHLKTANEKQWFLGSGSVESTGFEWSNSPPSLTHGILMWSQPFTVKGIDYSILLIDRQGTFGKNMDPALSTNMFGLSAMISSILIFNLKGVTNSNDITNLDCLAKFAETCSNLKSDKKHLQKLMLLVRDWTLADYEFGFTVLKKYVLDNLSSTCKVKDVKREIFTSCSYSSGFLMPHPGIGVTRGNVSRFDQIPNELKEVKNFIEGLFTQTYLEPKEMNGKILSGKQLMDYFERLVTLCMSRPDLTSLSTIKAADKLSMTQTKQSYKHELLKYRLYVSQTDNKILLKAISDEKKIKCSKIVKRVESEEYSRKEKGKKRQLSKDAFQEAIHNALAEYKIKATEYCFCCNSIIEIFLILVEHYTFKFPAFIGNSEQMIESRHTKAAENVLKTFRESLKGKEDEMEIERYNLVLSKKLNDEKKVFISQYQYDQHQYIYDIASFKKRFPRSIIV